MGKRANRQPVPAEELRGAGRRSVNESASTSTTANQKRAQRDFPDFVQQAGYEGYDPKSVGPETSSVIMDYLHYQLNMPSWKEDTPLGSREEAPSINGVDSLNGLIQGLRKYFEDNGHVGNWQPATFGSPNVTGNPLNSNPELRKFKDTHRRALANNGKAKVRASALTEEIMIALSLSFFLISGASVAAIRLHAILLLGLYCALRTYEISKFDYSHVTVCGRTIQIDLTRGTKQCDRAKK